MVALAPMPYDRSTQELRAKRAQKDLTALGKVNPLALEEFAALEERYNFLSTQLEDVKNARKDLLDVVAEVDERILQVFTEAYADVEREFVQVFATLFPGGEGRLRLTDPSDMLATGIEVEARPPGKKIKRLSLLSGGEKSLTALAFIFAIQEFQPSPLYVLDEVDMFLDSVNAEMVAKRVKKSSAKAQFIQVSLRKVTLATAEHLIGVTRQPNGKSKVIMQPNLSEVSKYESEALNKQKPEGF